MLRRPNLYTSYRSETSLLPTWTQRAMMALLAALMVLLPFHLPIINQIPVVRFIGDSDWLRILTEAVVFAIAALGLNLLTGVAGQVSLGHAFFMGVGACTAVYLGGSPGGSTWGHELPMWIWLPGAGICAALIGVLVAPAAVRVRGLYLGIATVGLVFIGIHLSKIFPEISGPSETGRRWPGLELRWWKEDEPIISFTDSGKWLWFDVTDDQKTYLLCLALLAIAILVVKNITRSRTGRALQAIRDRDIAAEMMGVPETKYKVIAFGISSFLAGIAGALFASFVGQLEPEYWDLFLSVEFIAIILIGGAGTVAGTLMGTFFVVMMPRFSETFAGWMSEQSENPGIRGSFWDAIVSRGDDFGIVSTGEIARGFAIPASALDALIYGALIVFFLLFEPLGLYGVWIKIRNYWKGWPFTY